MTSSGYEWLKEGRINMSYDLIGREFLWGLLSIVYTKRSATLLNVIRKK